MTKAEWLAWQKQVIREEYNETFKRVNENAKKQVNYTVKESLKKVAKNNVRQKYHSREAETERNILLDRCHRTRRV